MENNKAVLIGLLIVIGLGALYYSKNNQTKEGFAGGMPQRTARIEKLAVPVPKGALKSMLSSKGAPNYQNAKSVNFADYTNIQARPNVQYPYQSSTKPYIQEGYDGGMQGGMLGSSANTNMPFVTQPNFQQTTPLKAPSVQYSSFERYRPTSLDNMGRTESFNCGATSIEGFETDMEASSFPGTDYAAGNYNALVDKLQSTQVAAEVANTMDVLGPSGETTQVMVYERPFTVNLKAGRTNMPGVIDYIRGDLPVNVMDNRSGWFQASAGPSDLVVGSLSAIAGVNEADHVLKSMKKGYGSLSSNGVPASKDFNYAPMQFANMMSGLGDTTQITATAFP